MTPDKNDKSDTVVEDTQNVAANDTAPHSADTSSPGSTADSLEGELIDQDPSSDAAHNDNDVRDSLTNGPADDPLGFGDQRMDGNPGTGEELDECAQLQVQLSAAEAKAADYWDRLLRLQADVENQRKRTQNDLLKARKFALEGIVGDLLPVKDSLEMGLAAAQAEDADLNSIVQGAELTLKMLAQVFEKNNIVEVNPVDEKFDPEFHQAMSMQEIEGKTPNTIASVMQKGYTLNDRLVRPALVMVAK